MNLKSKIGGMVLAVVMMGAVAGCASPNLQTHYSNIELPNPEKPDIVFIVDETSLRGKTKNAIGTPSLISPFEGGYIFPVDKCLAKAINEAFSNVKILTEMPNAIDNSSVTVHIYGITDLIIRQGWASASVCKFQGEVEIKGNIKTLNKKINAEGSSGGSGLGFGGVSRHADKSTWAACKDFANQISQLLKSQGIKLTLKASSE